MLLIIFVLYSILLVVFGDSSPLCRLIDISHVRFIDQSLC